MTNWEQHFKEIYRNQPDTYHRLVAAEDAHGELAERLRRLGADAARVVDVGCGTGRLTAQLCAAGCYVHGVDVAPAMLEVASRELAQYPGRWALSVGDARELPIVDGWADAAIAGWVLGHLTETYPQRWPDELERAIAEMDRVVKPGGRQVVVDTLGTAKKDPAAPNPSLGEYHTALEAMGFAKTILATDYRFASIEESIELLDWFFRLGSWARSHNDPLVPEFTGWWERRR